MNLADDLPIAPVPRLVTCALVDCAQRSRFTASRFSSSASQRRRSTMSHLACPGRRAPWSPFASFCPRPGRCGVAALVCSSVLGTRVRAPPRPRHLSSGARAASTLSFCFSCSSADLLPDARPWPRNPPLVSQVVRDRPAPREPARRVLPSAPRSASPSAPAGRLRRVASRASINPSTVSPRATRRLALAVWAPRHELERDAHVVAEAKVVQRRQACHGARRPYALRAPPAVMRLSTAIRAMKAARM